ncbi:MAG: cytochrome C oxidase subunit IV family protein [Bacteroidia bacterium]|nr:cytochrome C oxidase subunit IV family protein [Bacteroidia bacterium]
MQHSDGSETRKEIFRTALILTALTTFEFVLAGIKNSLPAWTGLSVGAVKMIVLSTFVILTIFKAFYIVGVFMHLKDEVKRLAWTILIPFLFIIWLIIGLMYDGTSWGKQKVTDAGYSVVEQQA